MDGGGRGRVRERSGICEVFALLLSPRTLHTHVKLAVQGLQHVGRPEGGKGGRGVRRVEGGCALRSKKRRVRARAGRGHGTPNESPAVCSLPPPSTLQPAMPPVNSDADAALRSLLDVTLVGPQVAGGPLLLEDLAKVRVREKRALPLDRRASIGTLAGPVPPSSPPSPARSHHTGVAVDFRKAAGCD